MVRIFLRNVFHRFPAAVLIVAAVLLPAASSGVCRAEEKALQRFHALCVGLAYPGTGYKLDYTTRDASMIALAFEQASGFDAAASRIVKLVDDDPDSPAKPTPDEILRRLRRMASEAGDGDRIVFYFSGHGDKDREGNSFLVCHGGRSKDDARGYLRLSEVRKILADSGAESKLVVVDACHSGGKSGGENGLTPEEIGRAFRPEAGSKRAGDETLAWIASSDVGQESYEYAERRNGLFTYFFLEAIGGEAAAADINADGMLSVAEIHRYVNNHIAGFIAHEDKNPGSKWRGRNQTPRAGIGGDLKLNPVATDLQWINLFYVAWPPEPAPALEAPADGGEPEDSAELSREDAMLDEIFARLRKRE